MRLSFIFILLFGICGMGITQSQKENALKEHKKEYRKLIKKSRIAGVYIPIDVDDAMLQLRKKADSHALDSFTGAPEDVVAKKLHFGLGRWMIYHWNFEKGSRLSHKLINDYGLSYPDDMAQLLIRCFHRDLNKQELNPQEVADKLIEQRAREKQARFQDASIETLSTKKMDKGN